jgi:hypothetical protein
MYDSVVMKLIRLIHQVLENRLIEYEYDVNKFFVDYPKNIVILMKTKG